MRPQHRHRLVGLLLITLLICLVGAVVLHPLYSKTVLPPISANFTAEPVQAQSFEDVMAQASRQSRAEGNFRLTFTEEQISSWLGLEAATFATERGSTTFPFTNVQAGLDDGLIRVYAQVSAAAELSLPMELMIRPQVDSEGHLGFVIEQVRVGGVGLPSFLVEALTGQIDELIRKPFGR
ncbi:MAG TPA: hypothetical protein VHP83_19125, partial [Aggregatilineaceae bacterium]|nr:hypothetical protein [Aggregatilineaceae bacterium]